MSKEKSGMNTVFLMLLAGVTFGLIIGIIITYIPDDDSEQYKPTRVAEDGQIKELKPEKKAEPVVASSQKILSLLSTADALFVSRPGAGVFRSTDGENWETLRIGMESPREALSLVEVRPTQETLAAKIMELSMAEGKTPDPEELKAALMELAQQKPGILAGMRDGRIMRLDDDRWSQISTLPSEGGGVHALAYEPAVGLAACTGRGLYFSDDGGHNWTAVTNNSLTRDVLLGLDPKFRFIIAHISGGLSLCDSKGACEKIAGGPQRIRCLLGDKALAKTYYGSDGDGLWLYKRGGKPEQVTTSALDTADIHDIARIGARLIVAAGPSGLWMRKSEKSGWYPGRGLPPDSITTTAVFKGRVYAGSLKYGLFSAALDDADFKSVF